MACRSLLQLRGNLQKLSSSVSTKICRNSSSEAKNEKYYEPCVVDNPSQGYFVCWHPKQPLKYEHTKPISAEMERNPGVLNEVDMKLLQKDVPTDLMIAELKALTYTTKHIWYPKNEPRRQKPIRTRKYM
ncbi:Hypothetical predicted protein [Cloeon dipterum]|uniref:Large ribosomal subunit protein mL42 n=1 Tax=Cloeon dipterum TaxID=197152 RepID=A0A8S1DEU4_9INSE|nr:Hypothetical predicted protein [Cloeon dipterum]